MKAGRFFPLLLILCLLALLLSAQAMAAEAPPGNTIVMAGTDWNMVLYTTGTDSANGRLLMRCRRRPWRIPAFPARTACQSR